MPKTQNPELIQLSGRIVWYSLRPVAVLLLLAVLSGINLTDGIRPGCCLLSLPEHHWKATDFERPLLESTGSAILKFLQQTAQELARSTAQETNSTKAHLRSSKRVTNTQSTRPNKSFWVSISLFLKCSPRIGPMS